MRFEAVAESFLQVLLLARELKLVRVGLVSVDGTKNEGSQGERPKAGHDPRAALCNPGTCQPVLDSDPRDNSYLASA
jgi:hypothetical protein